MKYLWRQPDICDVRFWHFWSWRRVDHYLKLGIGEVAILVSVSIRKHLFYILVIDVHRKVLHQMDKVLLSQRVLLQFVFLGLEILWIRVCAAHHLQLNWVIFQSNCLCTTGHVFIFIRSLIIDLKHVLTEDFILHGIPPEFLKHQLAKVGKIDEASF